MRTKTGKEPAKYKRKTWLHCNRCEHRWKPRISKPRECPHCRTNVGWVRITVKRLRKEKLKKEQEAAMEIITQEYQDLRDRLKSNFNISD